MEAASPSASSVQSDKRPVRTSRRGGADRSSRKNNNFNDDEADLDDEDSDSNFNGPNHHRPMAVNQSSSHEPLYCYCRQVSFGEMIACDNDKVGGRVNYHFAIHDNLCFSATLNGFIMAVLV